MSSSAMGGFLVAAEEVACVYLFSHIGQRVCFSIGDDDVGLSFKYVQIVDNAGAVELGLCQHRLMDDDFNALGFDALHDALNAGSAEVVRAGFHDETVDTNNLRFATDYFVCNEIFAGGIGFDNGMDKVLGYVSVVGE